MHLHFTAGDRSAALRAYEACRAVLELELHVLPEATTEALCQRIRAGPNSAADSPSAGVFEGPLVGRATEFARLVELYEAASHGDTQVVVLQGEPGIGKTRLARDFIASSTAQGADSLHGRAFETGGRLPYQPLLDALRPRLERENAPEDLVSDIWLVELGRLLPELRERYPDLPAAAVDEAAERVRLFESIARLGQALGHQAPVVLFVDDLQWADVGSLDALHYVGRRWTDERTPVLLLLSLRTEALATTPTLGEWLANLQRAGHADAARVRRTNRRRHAPICS
jgi:predicted ATPase